jgi:hypothetical protein
MSTNTLERTERAEFTFDDLLAGESNVWASLDTTYDRGLRAGEARALRDHLGVIVAAAHSQIARRPDDRTAVLSFVSYLQQVLVNEKDREDLPFEFDGGLGI